MRRLLVAFILATAAALPLSAADVLGQFRKQISEAVASLGSAPSKESVITVNGQAVKVAITRDGERVVIKPLRTPDGKAIGADGKPVDKVLPAAITVSYIAAGQGALPVVYFVAVTAPSGGEAFLAVNESGALTAAPNSDGAALAALDASLAPIASQGGQPNTAQPKQQTTEKPKAQAAQQQQGGSNADALASLETPIPVPTETTTTISISPSAP
jgi:hypothetical protein